MTENHGIDMSPRPGEGKDLAQSVAKLERRLGLPDKPFLIWAVGSSFTNGLGDGSDLRQLLYERFPNAPEIGTRSSAEAARSITISEVG